MRNIKLFVTLVMISLAMCAQVDGDDVSGVAPHAFGIRKLAVTPTVLLVKRASGLKQIVALSAELDGDLRTLAVAVTVGGNTENFMITADAQGIVSKDLEVDNFDRPTPLEVSVDLEGERQTAKCLAGGVKHWKIYVQASSHVDIGYTHFQEDVKHIHNNNISAALDLIKQYPSFKWNTEVAWVADNYMSMTPKEKVDEFLEAVKNGHIGCQAVYGNMMTGIQSHEEIIRSLYFAHSMAKTHGLPFNVATTNDVPTQVWSLPTILAGSGIKYYATGLNGALVRALSFDKVFKKSPFYWQGPDGSQVLTWMICDYRYASTIGLTEGVDETRNGVCQFIADYDRANYPYDAVLALGALSDNFAVQPKLAVTVEEWGKIYEYPKIIYSSGPEFFEYVESNFKNSIPIISGNGGDYWADGAASSALETSMVRQGKEHLTTAEKIYSLATSMGLCSYPEATIAAAWKDAILYDEHTWGSEESVEFPTSGNTVKQWDYKSAFAHRAVDSSGKLVSTGLNILTQTSSMKQPSVLVYNPMSYPVSGPAKVDLADGSTGEIWAENVPPVGFGVYPLSKMCKSKNPLAQDETSIENSYYRIELDPANGAVKSIYDKKLRRELVDNAAPYRLNQYLYMVQDDQSFKNVAGNDVIAPVKITKESRNYGTALVATTSAYNAPALRSEVVLYDKIKRIDFLNTMDKIATTTKEGCYFAFPFALEKPQFHIQIPGGVVRPAQDMLDGGCMSWYSAQDFVAASDDNCAIIWTAIDSPLVTIGDIDRETFKSPLPINNGHLYAFVMNNYWNGNYKASQGGQMQFRFALTSLPTYEPVAATRFGESVRNPLLARLCGQTNASPQRGRKVSFCSVEPSNIVIQAVKKAEMGDGFIIRLREVGGKRTKAVLSLQTRSQKQAWSCNLMEDQLNELRVARGRISVNVAANGLATVLVR